MMTVMYSNRGQIQAPKVEKSFDDKDLAYYANQNLLHLVSKKWMSLSNPQRGQDDLDVILLP